MRTYLYEYFLPNRYIKMTSRLGDDGFVKTGASFTDTLTDEEILAKLENYIEMDIIDIPYNSHIRYFVYDKALKAHKFRLGGFVRKKDKGYTVISNGTKSWTVQNEIDGHPTAFFVLKSQIEGTSRNDTVEKLYEQSREELKRQQAELAACKAKLKSLEQCIASSVSTETTIKKTVGPPVTLVDKSTATAAPPSVTGAKKTTVPPSVTGVKSTAAVPPSVTGAKKTAVPPVKIQVKTHVSKK